MTTLREAAQAVLDRWDSPAWEWLKQGPTAALMSDLRAALAQERDEPVQEQVTYSTGGFQLEAGVYSADQLREMLKALESMNAAARRAMKEMT